MDNHIEQERVEARKALESALKGKWEATGEGWFNNPDCAKIVVKDAWGQTYVAQTYAGNHQVANAHLIANAPTWLRNSLDREEQLIAQIERENKEKHAFRRLENQHRKEKEQFALKVAEQDKEIQQYKSALRDSILERDEIIKILYESLEWYAKQVFKPEIAQLALDRINQS